MRGAFIIKGIRLSSRCLLSCLTCVSIEMIMVELLSAYLPYLQIASAILLTVVILLQQNEAGLGSAFGGNRINNPFATKRGLEKHLFVITIVLAVIFVSSIIANFFIK